MVSSVCWSATSPVITDTIQYLDVGLKLEIEPNIHMDGGVTMKVNLEVSTLGDSVTSRNGTVAFRVGTRNAATVLQLKDGETQTLMGLIQNDDIEKASRLPGLGDIPVLGRLFSNTNTDAQKTEIVLSITPRIVRNLARPDTVPARFASGTEGTPGAAPLRLALGGGAPMRLESQGAAAAAPAVGEEAVDNPYGLKALWTQGDFVARGTQMRDEC